METRKGARRRSEVTPEVLAGLNDGTLEALSLPEGLVVDFARLLQARVPEIPAAEAAAVGAEVGITRKMRRAGQAACAALGPAGFERLRREKSDTLRGIAAYLLAEVPGPTLAERLESMRPLADDPHFGVREWAWIALRPRLAADVDAAVEALLPWTRAESPNVRRFAAEVLRPRGVWCGHIPLLRQEPVRGLPLLSPLRDDPAKYVQDSVANWLHDAWKDRPEWVEGICERWAAESPRPATLRIVKRALRTRDKKA